MNRWACSGHGVGLFLALAFLLAGCERASSSKAPPNSQVRKQIEIEIEFVFPGEKPKAHFQIEALQGETVFDLLTRLRAEGAIAVESTGQGETAFVSAIDGVKNLGAAGDNWTYRVNGKLADRSCGVYQVDDGDRVEWVFGAYSEPRGDH